jgi:4-methyl-5(b-hydroxyethyl)-thiazole monophosphate biosynthesis
VPVPKRRFDFRRLHSAFFLDLLNFYTGNVLLTVSGMLSHLSALIMKKVLLLLAEGFEFYEASVFFDVFGWNNVEGDHSTQLFTCGFTKEIGSTFGQKIIVDHIIEELDPDEFDAMAIPGGFREFGYFDSAFLPEILGLIKRFHNRKKMIASIHMGAIVVAQSGVLTGKRLKTYNLSRVSQHTFVELDACLTKEPLVIDGNIITSWKPSTAIDVAFALLEHLTNEENVIYIKRLMGFEICQLISSV